MSSLRQNYSFLRFFNEDGQRLNFDYDAVNDKWTGSVYMDRVSTGLIEYEPIYVLEEIYNSVTGQNEYRKPKKSNLTPFCPGATQTNILANWYDKTPGSTTDNVNEIFLWEINGFPGPDPTIEKFDELDIDLGSNTNQMVGPSGGGATGQPVYGSTGATFLNEALTIKVGLQSDDEGSYTRTLQLQDPNYLQETSYSTFTCTGSTHTFAEIRYYGEVEAEDVRLETMIENLGSTIKNSDSKIFDDVDINEALPDNIKLNQKRKELLLEFENIFPYTGSYKALINILKYFGYDQVTLKEYWLNVEELKGNNDEGVSRRRYKQTPIEDLFSTEPKTAKAYPGLIPSKLYKKTSQFGLFYDITRDSGNFDSDGLPIVEEAFIFSNEEVLIKLFALKQKLKKYFLPLNARIVDIVGEAVFYSLYDINVWSDSLRVDDVELNINPCVKVLPEDGCSLITDLTATSENFVGIKVPPDISMNMNTDFQSYALGCTQTGAPPDHSGLDDVWLVTDTISGATFEYRTTAVGETSGQIVDGLISAWNSQTNEPFKNFNVFKYPVGSVNETQQLTGYAEFYAVQHTTNGPTAGVSTNFTLAPTPGPTTLTVTLGATVQPMAISGVLEFFSNAFMGYFDSYNTPINELNDYPCAPIGAPFVLDNCSFDLTWDESVVSYNSLDYASIGGTLGINYSSFDYSYTSNSYPLGSTNPFGASGNTGITWSGPSGGTQFANGATPGNAFHPPGPTFVSGFTGSTGPTSNPILYNWENVGYQNFYEMEWTVSFDDVPTPQGATQWSITSGLLGVTAGDKFPIILPYAGTYTVDLKLYDAFGSVSRFKKPKMLCVETKDIDFIGHYKYRECDYKWDTKTIKRQSEIANPPSPPTYPTWNMYNSNWNLPLHPNEEIQLGDLTYNDLDKIEFYQTQNDPQFEGFCDDVMLPPFSPGNTGSSGLTDLDSYYWNLIENNATWDDVCHLWWNGMGPKITQLRLDYGTFYTDAGGATFGFGEAGFQNVIMLMANEPIPLNPNKEFRPVLNTAQLLALPTANYGECVKVLTGTGSGVYQYLGGPLGVTGGTSWIQKDYTIDEISLSNLSTQGPAVTDIWKEAVRQINTQIGASGSTAFPYFNDFIYYYNEEYEDPNNPLYPYIQFVTKEFSSNTGKYHLRVFHNDGSNYEQATLFGDSNIFPGGALSTYETVNFGDMGDIPSYFEIFAVGACGGTLYLEGPSSWILGGSGPNAGSTVTGPTYWPYEIGATSLEDLWQQLTWLSQGLANTGPSAGQTAANVEGPIRKYEWNIVYGASGYTGPTGSTVFPPPSGMTAIKIQGSRSYFSSNDYECVKFGPIAATGYNGNVLGATDSGFAGTLCGRAVNVNPNWNDLRIHKYTNDYPLLTQLQFNYSSSPMNGKLKPRWTLIKENDVNWENIYYNNPYFSYTFTQRGSYTIELSLTDNKGNTRTKTKKEFVKII